MADNHSSAETWAGRGEWSGIDKGRIQAGSINPRLPRRGSRPGFAYELSAQTRQDVTSVRTKRCNPLSGGDKCLVEPRHDCRQGRTGLGDDTTKPPRGCPTSQAATSEFGNRIEKVTPLLRAADARPFKEECDVCGRIVREKSARGSRKPSLSRGLIDRAASCWCKGEEVHPESGGPGDLRATGARAGGTQVDTN